MASLTTNPPLALLLVTKIAHLVAHGDHRSTHSRHGGSLGTGKTSLVARSAQRGNGKHRLGAA